MKVLIIVALTLSLCGCGGLSRDTAKEMIDAHYQTHLKDKVIYPITLGLTASCPITYAPIYRFLLQKRLLKITQPSDYELTDEGTKTSEAEGEHLYAATTKDGCDIAQLNVILGHRGAVVITGIVMAPGETSAIVQYDRQVTLTPLGSEFAGFRKTFNLEQRISWRDTAQVFDIPDGIQAVTMESHTAQFVKYDDGWRIASIK